MSYDEWLNGVPEQIRQDPLWRLDVYRLSLYAADVAWDDALLLSKTPLSRDSANQLYRATCSISANIAEGYSRSTGKDRAHFLEYALGSSREARDWYYKAHHILNQAIITDRIDRLTQLIKILTVLTQQQRQKGLRESSAAYAVSSDTNAPLSDPEAELA